MGLDVVELVMECERKFDISLEDWKLERMRTVGDLFELICEQLKLPFVAEPSQAVPEISSDVVSQLGGWTRRSVWSKLVRVCTNQLQVDEDEVKYNASFSEDLGAD